MHCVSTISYQLKFVFLSAKFANVHVNGGVVDTYEHLPDVVNENVTNTQGKDYAELRPQYENHGIPVNSSRVDDNGYLNPV